MIPLFWAVGTILFAPSQESVMRQDIVVKSAAFELPLPRGYEPTTPPETPLRYTRSCGREPWARISVYLVTGAALKQNPSGITAEEVLPFVTLPPEASHTFTRVKWRDFDIGVIEYRAVVKDLPVLGLSAVLPLAGNALTLTVYAPDPLEKELREDFKELLSRVTKTTTNWYQDEELRKIRTLDMVGKVGMGLLVLYPIVWILVFRGAPMRAHWVRVGWLTVIAVLLFAPITSPGPTTATNNLIINAILPLGLMSFVVRRIKLGIDE